MSNDTYQRPEKTNGHSTWDEFNLKCKVVKFKKSWQESADNGRLHEGEMIALVFDKLATESHKFMTAWQPDADEKNIFEFAMFVGSPINNPARGCYMLADRYIKEDYIFLMNVALERDLIHQLNMHRNRLTVHVVIYPEDNDAMADDAPTIEKSVDTRFKGMGE